MKNCLLIACLTALLSGCIVVPSKSGSTPASIAQGVKAVENSKAVTRTTTRGPLLCENIPGCPELAIDWTKRQGANDLSIHIYSPNQIELNEFTFVVDGKKYSYSTIGAASYRQLENSNVIDSSNTVHVPSSLLTRFRNAKDIQVLLSSNQGDISHAVLSNGTQSKAYRLFLRAY